MEKQKKKRSPKIYLTKRAQCFTIQGQSSPPHLKEEKFILELKPFSTFPHITFDRVRIGEWKEHTLFIRNPLDIPQSVCIEKFPSEKGFSIEDVRFHIPPLNEIKVRICWKPEKVITCRETVLFKSSTGSRAQAYLHGTACSPMKRKRRKWDESCIKLKSSKVETKTESYAFQEKENVNLLNSNIEDLQNRSMKTNFFPSNFPDSPARRQTYTINSMFRPNASQIEQDQRMNNVFIPGESHDEIFNDSLESATSEISLEVNNDLNVRTGDFTDRTYVNSTMTDIKVFDLPSKHAYFGHMPDASNKTSQQLPQVCSGASILAKDVPEPFHLSFHDQNEINDFYRNVDKKNDTNIKNPTHKALGKYSSESCKTMQEIDVISSENSESVLFQSQLYSVKDLMQDINGIPLSSDVTELLTVKKTCSSLAFEIAHNNSVVGDKFPPLKSVDNLKRKTMFVSKKPQSAELLKKKLLSTSATSVKDARVKVKTERKPSKFLPKRLTLTKITAADKVYQRNPFATLNAYYDQYWIEKQEMAFTNWLNFILTPNDDFRSSEEVKVSSAEIWVESMKDIAPIQVPTKEDLSFKTYTAAKQLNRLRKSACILYQTEEFAKTIKRIEKEVDSKKICIRSDRAIHADLGIKKDLLEMLLSYNPLWLRIGLETVYGEMISLQNNRDVVGLSRFIIHRFLSNPDIAAKYAHSSVINYFKPGFEENLKQFIVKKFLLLVYFLDVAKTGYLIDHNPCLFCKTSKFKASRDLLITFSREYLSGEGDITKHLRYLGFIVKHEQLPIEEFDYAVKNIAVDLRCGLRLGRVVELLLQDWTISRSLRTNTLNRLTKIHNNDVILKALQKAAINIDGNIDARDIVDGNREKTLNLLWQIIFKTQVSKNVDLKTLKKENSYLRRSLKLKADCAAFDALQLYHDESESIEHDFLTSQLYKENEVIQQLFQWCQNVCAHYGIKVFNFTSSFSDGRALCFLLHHYHPNLLPSNIIKKDTTTSYFEEQMENLEDENCPFLPENRQMKSKAMEAMLKNERDNLELIFQKAQEIGHIPILSFPSHLSNTLPDEKVVITLVSYINIRLMELSVEIRAARTILLAYRKWKLRRKQRELKLQIAAAIIIQRYWRKYVENKIQKVKEEAVVIIQRSWKMYSAKKQLQSLKQASDKKYLNLKAIVIQAAFKGYRTRKHLLLRQKSSVIIQSCIRKWLARIRFVRLKQAVVKIQANYRAKVAGHLQRQRFLHIKRVVTLLQARFRGMQLRKEMKGKVSAAIVLQSWLRMLLTRKHYLKLKNACISLQQRFRSLLLVKKQVKHFQNVRQSVVIIQRWYLEIRKKRLERESAIKIQTLVRKCIQRKKYLQLRSSIISIQLWWKGVFLTQKTRSLFLLNRKRVILLQAHIRRLIAVQLYKKKKMSAVILQKNVRRAFVYKKFSVLKSKIVLIQRWWRSILLGRHIRNEYLVYRQSAVKIQSHWRMYSAQKAFHKLKRVVAIIERCRIGKKERRAYLSLRKSTIKLQSLFRGYYDRKLFCIQKEAVIKIQRYFRSYIIRQTFLKKKLSAIKIQQYFRSYISMCKEHQKYAVMKTGFTRLQAVYRSVKVRKQIGYFHEKACIIQTFYRKWAARNHYLKLRKASIVIQQKYRAQMLMKIQVLEYKRLRRSVVLIQAALRSRIEREKFLLQKRAVVKIQSLARMLSARRSYCQTREKVILIQRYQRSKRLRNIQMGIYSETRKRIIFLQSEVRCFIARRKYLKMKTTCILVQSVTRMWLLRNKYSRLRNATLVIQRKFRSLQVAKETRHKYLTMKSAAIRIQSFYRMVKQFKKFQKMRNSAIFIQKTFRALLAARKVRGNFVLQKRSCIKIQSGIRMIIERKKFLKMRHACITIQSSYRMYVIRKEYLEMKKSVSTLQKHYVAWKIGRECRQQFIHMKYSAIVIQAAFRGYAIRKEFKLKKNACITIQSYIRRFICQKRCLAEKNAARVLQKHIRAFIIGRQIRRQYINDRNCIIITQALVRGWFVRRRLQELNRSAIMIQKIFKSFICRKKFIQIKTSAIILQKCFKSHMLRKRVHLFYLKLQCSATVIQSAWRGFKARCEFRRKIEATVVLQSHVRKMLLQRKYLAMRRSVISIQRYYMAYKMGIKEYRLYHIKRESCIRIQLLWRGFVIRRRIEKQTIAAVLIQKYFRSWRQKRKEMESLHMIFCQQHQWYMHLRSSIIAFQRHSRYYLQKREKAAVLIQSYFRMWRIRRCFRKFKAAVKIQALWRGYLIRKNETDQKICNLRCNIKNAPSDEHDWLKSRMTRALETLLTDRKLRCILTCLQNLDVCTKLSPICCERLTQSEGISIIAQLIRSCNRSVPHKEVIKYSTNILLNLAKYEKTVNSVWADPAVLHMILDLMKIYRDKGVDIFNKGCTLFYIFCQDTEKAELLKQNSVFCSQIQSFHDLLMRKLSIEEKRSRSSALPSRATFLRRFHDRNSAESLNIDPDWLLGQHRRREFKDPCIAITSLMHALGLQVTSS